jgi:hypothetical protein
VLRLDRGGLEAFQAGTGRLLWRTAGVHHGQDFEAHLTVRDDGVVVWEGSSAATAVAAYRLDTGKRRWRLGGPREPAVVGVGRRGLADRPEPAPPAAAGRPGQRPGAVASGGCPDRLTLT